MPDWLVWLGAFHAWCLIGWLPSRVIKHYFVTRFEATVGDNAWEPSMERWLAVFALAGPYTFVALLAWRLATYRRYRADPVERVPWGWMW